MTGPDWNGVRPIGTTENWWTKLENLELAIFAYGKSTRGTGFFSTGFVVNHVLFVPVLEISSFLLVNIIRDARLVRTVW